MSIQFSASALGTRNVYALTRDLVTNYFGVGDGTTDNSTALNAFKAEVGSNAARVKLTTPSGNFKISPSTAQFFGKGIADFTFEGAGIDVTTLTVDRASSTASLFLSGIGQLNDNTHNALFQTASAGDTSVFLVTPSQASRFPAGTAAVASGLDLQGTIGGNYGFPTNEHFFDHAIVVSNNVTTGELVLDRALSRSYKSTWPVYYNGSSGGTPQGGAAMIFALDPSWNATVVIRKMTISDQDGIAPGQIVYTGKARNVLIDTVKFVGPFGPGPSENENVEYRDSILTGNIVEVDKFIKNLTLTRCTGPTKLWFQSSSCDLLTMTDTNMTFLSGTPKKAIIRGGSIADLRPGSNSYGASTEMDIGPSANSSPVVSSIQLGVFSTPSAGYLMSAGVIRTRKSVTVTGIADNGSGKVRVAVTDTTDLQTGQSLNASGVFTSGPLAHNYVITLVDGTHFDLLAQGISGATWTGSGAFVNFGPPWAVPGEWCTIKTARGVEGFFKVVDISADASYIYVTTNLAGAWLSGVSVISPHPCRIWRCVGATGCADIVDYSQAGAQARPWLEYSKRTYNASMAAAVSPVVTLWGGLNFIEIAVSAAYTGVSSLTWKLSQFDNWTYLKSDGTTASLAITINTQIAGTRRIIPGGVNTGAKSGDSLPTLPAGTWLMGPSNSGPVMSRDVSAEGLGPTLTCEIDCTQGVI